MLKKINATGNPGCTLFNSECTISAKNTLRIGTDIAGRLIRCLSSYSCLDRRVVSAAEC